MKKHFPVAKKLPRTKVSSNENIIVIVVIVVLLLIIANMFAYWLYKKGNMAQLEVQGQQIARSDTDLIPITDALSEAPPSVPVTPQAVVDIIRTRVSLDTLSQESVPIVAEIVNRDGLAKEYPIFEESQNGDYFVLYGSQLIFYRPSEDRVVLFQRIDPNRFFQEVTQKETSSSTASIEILPATIELRTGALSQKVTEQVGETLAILEWVVSLDINTSEKNTYTQTVIVDQTNNANPGALHDLTKRFGGQIVMKVPEGEKPSGADFLVIFGP